MFKGLSDFVLEKLKGLFQQPKIISPVPQSQRITPTPAPSSQRLSLSDLVNKFKSTITNPQTYKNVAGYVATGSVPGSKPIQLPRVKLPVFKNPVGNFVTRVGEDIINQIPSSIESSEKIKQTQRATITGEKPTIKSVPQYVAEGANAALAPLMFTGGGQAGSVAKSAVKVAGKQALKKVIIQGAKTGAKIGGGYGAVQGVASQREKPNVSFKDEAIASAMNALAGLGLGAATGGALSGGAAVVKNAVSKLTKPALDSADLLLKNASEKTPKFQSALENALKDLQVTIKHGPEKTKQRLLEKMAVDYKNHPEPLSQIRDAVRSAVLVDRPTQVAEVLARLKTIDPNLEVRPINNSTGYKATRAILDLGDGVKSEVQIASPEMWEAKTTLGGNKLYKAYRVTGQEFEQLKAHYQAAADAEAKRLNSVSSISEPSKAFATGKGSPEAVSPTTSSPSLESLTGVPSQSKNLGKVSSIEESIAQDMLNINPKEKQRGFITTVKQSENTAPEVKQQIKGTYLPITNKQTLAEADSIINANFDEAVRLAKEGESSALNNAIALRLISKFQNKGDFNQAIDLIETLAKKPTSQGQAIQVLSLYNRLTPEGALRYAQRLVDRANKGKTSGFVQIGEIAAKRITELAKEAQALPEGSSEKMIKTAELVEALHGVVPVGLLQKISTIQIMAQLLNPKTAIRNIVGNLGFMAGENISDVVAAPVDAVLSLITGKRTKVLPNPLVQAKGFTLGLVQGVKEALKGVNTQPNVTSQFDLPATRTFGGVIGQIFEKALNIELRVPDRAFYRAAFENSLDQQMRIAKVTEPTTEMLEQAHFDGLYRTFQDKNVVTKLFTGLKRALNLGKDFGLGDLILKYPKTPASLISRGLDYSPAGFTNMIFQMAKPLFGRPFDQKAFVEAFSRALVGTSGLITTGAILQKLGIITGAPEKDKDIAGVQRIAGLGGYRINVSATKRFVASGFNADVAKPEEGDTIISYDWFQPFAIGLSMGANIAENNGKIEQGGQVATILDSLQGGVETLYEQPLVRGFRQLFQGYDPVSALVTTLESTPGSFTPTLLNQMVQYGGDNITKNTYDRNPVVQALNIMKAKIPGVESTLPIKYDVFGNPQERYQGASNTFLNVFFNPAFVSTLKQDPSGQEVLNIFERSGETQQAPRVVAKSIKVNGKDLELTAEQQGIYQRFVGQVTKGLYDKLIEDEKFKTLPDADKAKTMAGFLTDINSAAKILLFGDRPKTVDKQVKNILGGNVDFSNIKSQQEKDYEALIGKSGYLIKAPSKPTKPSLNSGKSAKLKIKVAKATKGKTYKINFKNPVIGNGAFKTPAIKIVKSKRPVITIPNFA